MPAVAPLVAAIRRRLTNLPGPLRGSGEASNGEPVQVELLVAGEWVDITSYCLVRDDNGQIAITSGIRDEGSQTERAQARLQLKNGDGRFSPRNPMGAYYDILNWRNAQMRISVPDGNGGKAYRIWGEVSEWAPNWDSSGSDVWVDVTINGILQRLAQGPAREHSVIYDAITRPEITGLRAYWPCEDPAGATQLASALVTGSPMTFIGQAPDLASFTQFGASAALPTFTGAATAGSVAKYNSPAATQVRFLLYVPPAGAAADLDLIVRVTQQEDITVSPLTYYELFYNAPRGTYDGVTPAGSLSLELRGSDGTTYGAILHHGVDVRGKMLRVSLEFQENGSDTIYTVRTLDLATGSEDAVSQTRTSEQLNRVTAVAPFVSAFSVLGPDTADGLPGGAIGHITVQDTITDIDDLGVRLNPIGEAAGRRVQRLCGEEAIPFEWIGDLDDTTALGAQGLTNPLSLIQEAVLADGGLLYETRSVLGLGYRTRSSLYNQDPALTLSYTGFNLSEIPVPVSDDRYLQNRVTVTVNGVSETYEETTGALGTATVGVYGETSGTTLNLASTDAVTLRDQAAWRVHLGVTEDERFPQISVNLAHPSITPVMRRAILALRLGDRIQLAGMPGWLAPDTVDQLLLGIEQTITHFEHRLTLVCAPASPYTIGYLDETTARIDTDGSELLTAAGTSDTTLYVAPSLGQSTLWTKDSAECPFDVRVGGEVMRVTAVSDFLTDAFGRTSGSSWGTADSGQAWGTGGGTATDYAVSAGVGSHTLTSVDASRRTFIDATFPDVDYYVSMTTSATPTGGSLYGGPTARYLDSSNMYQARLEVTTSSTLILSIRKRVADVDTQLGTYTLPDAYVAGTYYRIRFQVQGAALKAKAWAASDIETPEWQVTAADSAHSTSSFLGLRSIAAPTNSNVNPVVRYDNVNVISPQTFTVTRSINGVTKSHAAGADVRLADPTPLAL